MTSKCVSCKKPITDAGPTFRHEHTPLNRYAARRKPVTWCAPCWDEAVRLNDEYRAMVDRNTAREVAAAIAKAQGDA